MNECKLCGAPVTDLADDATTRTHNKGDCPNYGTVTMAELRALQFKARAGQLVMPFHKEAMRARMRP